MDINIRGIYYFNTRKTNSRYYNNHSFIHVFKRMM